MGAASHFRRFRRSDSGVSAVEFALLLPLMLLLFFGGFVVSEAITIRRKVSITTRTLADLASQVTTLSTTDMQTILNAATQVIAPYAVAPISIRLSEISTDITGLHATVTWSTGLNTTKLVCNQSYTLPLGMGVPNTSYILSEVSYLFSPMIGYAITSPLALGDHIFMAPRLSQSVSYPCPG